MLAETSFEKPLDPAICLANLSINSRASKRDSATFTETPSSCASFAACSSKGSFVYLDKSEVNNSCDFSMFKVLVASSENSLNALFKRLLIC